MVETSHSHSVKRRPTSVERARLGVLVSVIVVGVCGCRSSPEPLAHPSLIEAVFASDAIDVRRHLRQGADPNTLYNRGNDNVRLEDSVLHLAANNGNEDVVGVLLEFGANPNIENSAGFTPMDYVRVRFAEAGLDPDNLPSALPEGVSREGVDHMRQVMRLLLEHGATARPRPLTR